MQCIPSFYLRWIVELSLSKTVGFNKQGRPSLQVCSFQGILDTFQSVVAGFRWGFVAFEGFVGFRTSFRGFQSRSQGLYRLSGLLQKGVQRRFSVFQRLLERFSWLLRATQAFGWAFRWFQEGSRGVSKGIWEVHWQSGELYIEFRRLSVAFQRCFSGFYNGFSDDYVCRFDCFYTLNFKVLKFKSTSLGLF